MMNFGEYTEAVLAEIRARTEGTFDVLTDTVTKNNGIKLTGILAVAKGNNIGPCIYLDDFYKEYADGRMEFGETVDEIYRLLVKHQVNPQSINISGFRNWETARYSVRAKLVNAAQNKGMLEKIPHRLFLDLAVVYYAMIDGFGGQNIGTVLINNRHMEMWGQNEGNLYERAIANMRYDGNPCFDSLENAVKHILADAGGLWEGKKNWNNSGMYILTNRRKCYGVSEILDKHTMRVIADVIGDGFIILPSSVHEVIILRPDSTVEYEKLADMVKEVNDTQVSEEERLSYHVYAYNRSEERLKIVA